MLYGILITLSVLVNVLLIVLLKLIVNKTYQYDNMLNGICDDLDLFVSYVDDVRKTTVFSQHPDLVNLHNNLVILRERFHNRVDEFSKISSQRERIKYLEAELKKVKPVVVD